jgi:hypothetical protein
MKKALHVITLIFIGIGAWLPQSAAQDKKLEKIRIATAGLKGDFSRASIFDFSAAAEASKEMAIRK